jgi:HD superfamily phosphohydrolase
LIAKKLVKQYLLDDMKKTYKIIRDSIHGDIRLEGIFQDLLDSPELQRLCSIKQLGLAHLVFPGAHHTRLEHSIGVYHMASMISQVLTLSDELDGLLRCASLLHDIGHGPFSHTLESILREKYNADHVDLTEKLILGEYDIFYEEESSFLDEEHTVCSILESYDVDNKNLISIIRGKDKKHPFLGELLNSVVDVDQLDYLLRDSYYTGVAYGMIDSQRFAQTVTIYDDHLALNRKGIGVVENILMARSLMYTSVYFHKTVRIAELMLSKAIESIPDMHPFDFFRLTDAELIKTLGNIGDYQKEIVTRLKYRRLFKQVFVMLPENRSQQRMEFFKRLEDSNYRRYIEARFEDTLSIPQGHIIIDVPLLDIIIAEPRIQEIDMPVVDNEGIKMLTNYTPVATAIGMRKIPDWDLMILSDEKYRDDILKNANDILFSS